MKQLSIRGGRLFARLDEAVTTRNVQLARELLARANATAAHDRAEDEDRIAGAAADFAVAQTRVQEAANAERAMERAEEELAELTARAAFETVRRVLRDLRHRPRRHMSKATLYSQVQLLVEEAAKAGKYVTASQHQEIDRWVKRAEHAQAGARPDGSCTDCGEGPGVVEAARERGHRNSRAVQHDHGVGVEGPLRRPARRRHANPPRSIRAVCAAALKGVNIPIRLLSWAFPVDGEAIGVAWCGTR
ncbi:hypothetical protein [Streptomyces sp. NPDC059455]|uniref:hypothetical protein n=1 Tax=Streptomyces sp. NPDC059455 TaxID=3346837 RepID=UPI0036A57D92